MEEYHYKLENDGDGYAVWLSVWADGVAAALDYAERQRALLGYDQAYLVTSP